MIKHELTCLGLGRLLLIAPIVSMFTFSVAAQVSSKPGASVGYDPVILKPAIVSNENDSTYQPNRVSAKAPEGTVPIGGGGEDEEIIIEAPGSVAPSNGWTLSDSRMADYAYNHLGLCVPFDYGSGAATHSTNCVEVYQSGDADTLEYVNIIAPNATVASNFAPPPNSGYAYHDLRAIGSAGNVQVVIDSRNTSHFEGQKWLELWSTSGVGGFGSALGWTVDPADKTQAILMVGSPDEDSVYFYRFAISRSAGVTTITRVGTDVFTYSPGSRFGTSIATNDRAAAVGAPNGNGGDGFVLTWRHSFGLPFDAGREISPGECRGPVGDGSGVGRRVAFVGTGLVSSGVDVAGFWRGFNGFPGCSNSSPSRFFRGPPSFGSSLAYNGTWVAIGAPAAGRAGAMYMFAGDFEARGSLEFPFEPDDALIGHQILRLDSYNVGAGAVHRIVLSAPNWVGGDVRPDPGGAVGNQVGRIFTFINAPN